MSNPATNPVQFLVELQLDPESETIEASEAALACIATEKSFLLSEIKNLDIAREQIIRRLGGDIPDRGSWPSASACG